LLSPPHQGYFYRTYRAAAKYTEGLSPALFPTALFATASTAREARQEACASWGRGWLEEAGSAEELPTAAPAAPELRIPGEMACCLEGLESGEWEIRPCLGEGTVPMQDPDDKEKKEGRGGGVGSHLLQATRALPLSRAPSVPPCLSLALSLSLSPSLALSLSLSRSLSLSLSLSPSL